MVTPIQFTQDDVAVRFHVQAGFALTLGLYDGPVTREVIAQAVAQMIADNGIAEFIETVELTEVGLDDGTVLAHGEG